MKGPTPSSTPRPHDKGTVARSPSRNSMSDNYRFGDKSHSLISAVGPHSFYFSSVTKNM